MYDVNCSRERGKGGCIYQVGKVPFYSCFVGCFTLFFFFWCFTLERLLDFSKCLVCVTVEMIMCGIFTYSVNVVLYINNFWILNQPQIPLGQSV